MAEFSQAGFKNSVVISLYCFPIKILLRILFSQQNYVRILILFENFVSYKHHYLHGLVSIMIFVLSEILLWYQNSDKILLGEQNPKQNFDCRTRISVDNDVCLKQNSDAISEFWQNSASENKILSRILIVKQGDYETSVGVNNDVCLRQNSARKTKF